MGSIANTDFTRNRFYKGQSAFHYASADPPLTIAMKLSSNTFTEIGSVFEFKAMPAVNSKKPEKDNLIKLRNNLFFRVPALVRAAVGKVTGDELRPLFEEVGTVFHEDSGNDGIRVLPNLKRLAFDLDVNPAPERDASFLRYPVTSKLYTAGADDQPVGVPPLSINR
jgi:hypothetical protein